MNRLCIVPNAERQTYSVYDHYTKEVLYQSHDELQCETFMEGLKVGLRLNNQQGGALSIPSHY